MEITRRSFLKLGTIFGVGSLLPSCTREYVLKPKEESLPFRGEEKVVHSVCAMCPAGCGVLVRKAGRYAVGVSGLAGHPINQGSLCPKGAALLQELYHPDRLKSPLLRHGERGRSVWTSVSWDEAISVVAQKILRAKADDKRLFASLTSDGCEDIHQELLRKLASALGRENFFSIPFPMGEFYPDVPWHLKETKLVVSFGFDWLSSHPAHVEIQRVFGELRRGPGQTRARIVQIEPRFSVSAAKADEWIGIRPGTEGILALALARHIIASGSYDQGFIRAHTRGFEELKASLEAFTIAKASQMTGVPEQTIRLLALQFLSSKPSAAITNRGPLLTQMAVHALNVLLGNIGSGKPFSLAEVAKSLPRERLGSEGPLPEVLLVDRVNPFFTAPKEWREVFEKIPFVVVVTPHLTETAEFADMILPCHTPLEGRHLSWHPGMDGKTILNGAPSAVEPFHDTKEPGEIFLALSQAAMGKGPADFGAYFDGSAKALGAAGFLKEDTDAPWLEQPSPLSKNSLSFEPSGKTGFSELARMAAGLNKLAVAQSIQFPLTLYLFTPLVFSRGEGAHLPYLMSLAGPQLEETWETWAEAHPETMKNYGVSDGDMIWIESARGKIKARVRAVPSAMPGVVSVPVGLGHTAYGRWAKGVGANPLEIADEFWSTPVRIERT